jgi:teichuronic acid biosynthesis glycosyltransferase TuaG
MPEISVIMPAYNAADFIEETIQSIICQSCKDWELVITDDGSEDRTVEIIEQCFLMDSRVRLLTNECGKGPAAARNNSINQSTGDYIAFLDSDDVWRPTKLEAHLVFMKRLKADFSYTAYNHISVDSALIKQINVPGVVDYKSLLTGNLIATSTVMIRRSAFRELVMPDFPRAQDFALWLTLLHQTDFGYGLNEALSDYRITPNTGKRRKIFALKYLYDIYTRQERKSPMGACVLIFRMLIHRVFKYGRFWNSSE